MSYRDMAIDAGCRPDSDECRQMKAMLEHEHEMQYRAEMERKQQEEIQEAAQDSGQNSPLEDSPTNTGIMQAEDGQHNA